MLNFARRIKNTIAKHKWIFVGIALVVIGGLASNYVHQKNIEKAAISFQAQQAAKKKNLAQTLYDAKAKENKARELADAKTNHLIQTLNVTDKSSLPTCDSLHNRPGVIITSGSCDYRLRAKGQIDMAVVFLWDQPSDASTNELNAMKGPASSEQSLQYTNTYLHAQEAVYGKPSLDVKLSYYGPFETRQPIPGSNTSLSDTQAIAELFASTSKANNVPESKYDITHYVYLPTYSFRSFALPSSHRAYTNPSYGRSTATFIHETLHMFGASDKYNNNDCNTRGKSNPFGAQADAKFDIMCSDFGIFDNINVNIITAREIGWTN